MWVQCICTRYERSSTPRIGHCKMVHFTLCKCHLNLKIKAAFETDPRRDGGGLGIRGERSKCLLSVHEAPARQDSPPAGSAWSRRGRGCGWGAGVTSCPSDRRTGSLEPAVAPSPFPGCPMRPPRPLPGSPVHRGPAEPASLTCLPPPPHPTLTRPPPSTELPRPLLIRASPSPAPGKVQTPQWALVSARSPSTPRMRKALNASAPPGRISTVPPPFPAWHVCPARPTPQGRTRTGPRTWG